jgi:hypothetical protein
MKLTIISLLILFSGFIGIPKKKKTEPHAFTIGTKFVLELVDDDEGNYDFKVLSEESIDYKVDYSKSEDYFSKNPVSGTIECVFAKGKDQSGPFKSVLLIKSNMKVSLNYKAEISYKKSGKFYSTSVSMLFPGVRSRELWNDKLNEIILHDFSKADL